MNPGKRYAIIMWHWLCELRILLGIFAIAAAVGLVTAVLTGPAPTHHAGIFGSHGGTVPSWDLVPGNSCWYDKADVMRQLEALKYHMAYCEPNDGGLIAKAIIHIDIMAYSL